SSAPDFSASAARSRSNAISCSASSRSPSIRSFASSTTGPPPPDLTQPGSPVRPARPRNNPPRSGRSARSSDVRSYGRSTRPAEMDQPADANKPIASSEEAGRDLGAAVDYILSSRGIAKLNLIGWSWGTSIAGNYTSQHNDKMNRLVLYAPAWTFQPPKEPPAAAIPAYRLVSKDSAKARWYKGVPADKQATLIDPARGLRPMVGGDTRHRSHRQQVESSCGSRRQWRHSGVRQLLAR